MFKVAIDGKHNTGRYRVDCECGDNWSGEVELDDVTVRNPAMPIAEVIAHMRMMHPDSIPDLRFSHRFSVWLLRYWEHFSRVDVGALVPTV